MEVYRAGTGRTTPAALGRAAKAAQARRRDEHTDAATRSLPSSSITPTDAFWRERSFEMRFAAVQQNARNARSEGLLHWIGDCPDFANTLFRV
jgi:hypothetical protein